MSGFFFFAVRDGEPGDKELSDIADKFSEEWRKIGRLLGVPGRTLKQIGVNHKGDAYEMAFQALLSWKENSSDGAISRYQELFDALAKIGRSDLAKKCCCY